MKKKVCLWFSSSDELESQLTGNVIVRKLEFAFSNDDGLPYKLINQMKENEERLSQSHVCAGTDAIAVPEIWNGENERRPV